MKNKKRLWIVLAAVFLFLSGCGSISSEKPGTPSYSFVEENTKGAKITFERGVRLVDLNGIVPSSAEGTSWSSALFPAGRPLNIRVYIYWDGEDTVGNRRRGIFKSPALEAGGEYRLRFKYGWYGYFKAIPVGLSLVLEKVRNSSSRKIEYDTVYEQAIPPFD